MVSYAPMLPPTIWIAVEIAVTALTIGLTSSSSKLLRLSGLLLVTAVAYLAFLAISRHFSTTLWASLLATNASTYVLQCLDLALLDQWNFDDGGPVQKTRDPRKSSMVEAVERKRKKVPSCRDGTTWERLCFGLNATLSPRHLNTPYQVKNVPAWSSAGSEHIPSREDFLWRTAFIVLFGYMILDLCSLGAQPERNAIMFSSDKVGFFSRLEYLGTEEVTVRVLTALVQWLHMYCVLRVIYGLSSFLAVGSGISEVQDWAPPFGSLSEAYSIRRFWGIFWHQMYRQTFGTPAHLFVHDILHLSQDTLLARYSKILTTFYISGLLHLSIDIAIGIPWGESGAIRFFCTQAFGIFLEDSIQALYRRIGPKIQRSSWRQKLVKMMGHVWLSCFLAWSTPVWAYPWIRRNQGTAKDVVLSFSVVGMIRNGMGWRGV